MKQCEYCHIKPTEMGFIMCRKCRHFYYALRDNPETLKKILKILPPIQTFPINAQEITLINNMFNVKIIPLSVRTIDTGGGVMNDIYNTSDNTAIIIVYEYGTALYATEEDLNKGNFRHIHEWQFPLYSIHELEQLK